LTYWPQINRGLPLLITNPHMKYHNNLKKSSQDIERTSSGLPTDRHTNRQVQSNMPLFFERGRNNVILKYKITTLWNSQFWYTINPSQYLSSKFVLTAYNKKNIYIFWPSLLRVRTSTMSTLWIVNFESLLVAYQFYITMYLLFLIGSGCWDVNFLKFVNYDSFCFLQMLPG
jgi:hypothetical protein